MRATALYVVVEADETALQRAQAAVSSAHVESVLIRAASGLKLDVARARPLVETVQRAGVAAVIDGDARLARTLRADGVHLRWSDTLAEAYAEVRDVLGTRAIVGVEAGGSRHDAMAMAEAGADYIGFGAQGSDEAARQARDDLAAWWAEIFEVPCVAFDVAHAGEAAALAATGVDFIGMTLARGETLAAAAARIAAFAAACAPR